MLCCTSLVRSFPLSAVVEEAELLRGGGGWSVGLVCGCSYQGLFLISRVARPFPFLSPGNTTTALMAPWQYPRLGVPGQYLVGLSYLDYCPAITAYSNGDCQDSSLAPSGTNYYGFVFSVRPAGTGGLCVYVCVRCLRKCVSVCGRGGGVLENCSALHVGAC
jgi:hypothetical protein